MKYTIDKHDRYVVIEPHATFLNGDVAAKLKGEFLLRNTGGLRNIVLDLSQVTAADEQGIRTGVLAHRLCSASGGVFILINVCDSVVQLLKMSKLDKIFHIAKNLTKAEDIIFGVEIERQLKTATQAGND